jgi:hypothetical protein
LLADSRIDLRNNTGFLSLILCAITAYITVLAAPSAAKRVNALFFIDGGSMRGVEGKEVNLLRRFALGFIMGMSIAVQSDRGGWMPPNGWELRLLAGFFTGGIGMVLGLVSGPPRL